MTTFTAIIPARYASTRFPGKPLAILGDKPVIQHVYERASSVLDNVLVATDDSRILDAVYAFGGKAVKTGTHHRSGTDRCREAYVNAASTADVVINIQGDEPFIAPQQIELLMHCFEDPHTHIATLARRYDPANGIDGLVDPNLVKVVFGHDGRALYFSRSVIPYVRNVEPAKWLEATVFHTHVGVYAYRADVLEQLSEQSPGELEVAESLEQLRWLQNGYNIKVAVTDAPTIGIDTPADLDAARKYLESHGNA